MAGSTARVVRSNPTTLVLNTTFALTAAASSRWRRPVTKTCAPSLENSFAVAKADAAVAASYKRDFSSELTHAVLLRAQPHHPFQAPQRHSAILT